MTEKRFVFDPSITHFQDTLTDQEYSEYNLDDVVDMLNELSEENQHLNYDNKRMVKFIMSKGYGLKDYLDFCKEYKE